MQSPDNKTVKDALNLVDGIYDELLRVELKAGHSTEMARIRRARLKVNRLRKILRSPLKAESSILKWMPFMREVALFLIKQNMG